MSDEEILKENKKEVIDDKKVICIGADFGTMNICFARSDSNEIKIVRNAFLSLDSSEIEISELSNINYVESDNKVLIIGDDAFKFANIFGQKVLRPMENGVISPKEISSIDVLSLIIKDLIGDTKNSDVYCTFSIPSKAIDDTKSVVYHEKVFSRILSDLGVNNKSLNEAMAIIYSECSQENFSGIGISFGAGMCNVACAFKGVEALKFSTARSGDWVDKNVSESLNIIQNRVTSIKEKSLNLSIGFENEKNPKTRRILEALYYYYENLIEYTIKKIIKEFNDNIDVEIEDSIPIIVSGGTSLPEGFLELFINSINKYDIPFNISEIRMAKNPLTAVSQGLLIKTISDYEK